MIGLDLHFGQLTPISLGHMTHTTPRIFPFLHRNGIVKQFPQRTIFLFGTFCLFGFPSIKRYQSPLSRLMQQGLTVGLVIDHKTFVGIPRTKMCGNQRQHTVFRFNHRAQRFSLLGKPHKPQILMAFSAQSLHRFA